MDIIKFISFNDVHISSMNPQARLGNYKQDIMDKLTQIKKVGDKLDVDFYVFAGDLFNLKAPMRNPHELNSVLIDFFRSIKAPVYATEGNHDLRNDSYETFDEQPLRVLYASNALLQIRNVRLHIKNTYINLRSFPFQENPDFDAIPKVTSEDGSVNICALHLYSSPTGGMLFKNKVYSYDTISMLGDDIFIIGHYHIDQGIHVLEANGKKQYFANLGAISRGILVEDNLTRIPKIGLFTIKKENGKIIEITSQAIKLNVKPAEKVFDLQKKEEEVKNKKEAEDFVNKLKENMEVEVTTDDPLKTEITSLNLDKKILDRVTDLLQEADIKLKEIEK